MQIRWQTVVTILIIYIPTLIKFINDKKKKKVDNKIKEKDRISDFNYLDSKVTKKEDSSLKSFLSVSKEKEIENKNENLEDKKKRLAKELLEYLPSIQKEILEKKYFSIEDKINLKDNENDNLNKEDVYKNRLNRLEKINEERMSYKNNDSKEENILEEFDNEIENGFNEKELVNALIMKEILDKPISFR